MIDTPLHPAIQPAMPDEPVWRRGSHTRECWLHYDIVRAYREKSIPTCICPRTYTYEEWCNQDMPDISLMRFGPLPTLPELDDDPYSYPFGPIVHSDDWYGIGPDGGDTDPEVNIVTLTDHPSDIG